MLPHHLQPIQNLKTHHLVLVMHPISKPSAAIDDWDNIKRLLQYESEETV